jgi:hypothetical protein
MAPKWLNVSKLHVTAFPLNGVVLGVMNTGTICVRIALNVVLVANLTVFELLRFVGE